jgi:hypothetical protein
MKTKPTSILVLLVLILSSCAHNYEFWDISKFKMDETALEDNEEIKLLYSSRAPDDNKDMNYYIHLVAVSQKTGDTVNILTTANNGFNQEDGNKVFNFFNEDNVASKVLQEKTGNNNSSNKPIDKVARDPQFDEIADNNYPTVIGVIGTLAKNNE